MTKSEPFFAALRDGDRLMLVGKGWVLVPETTNQGIKVPSSVVRTHVFRLFLNGYYIRFGNRRLQLQSNGSAEVVPCCSVCGRVPGGKIRVIKPPTEPCLECGGPVLFV
jgi:hypothetical protein